MADVGECTVFLKDMADYAAMNAVYVTFFPVDPPSRAMAYRGSFTASFIRNGTPYVIHLGAGTPRRW